MTDDSALLSAAKKLDKDGLTTIFDTYAPAIYKYVLRLCHDPVDTDNIVGAVFSLLLEQFAAGKGPLTNLRSYLYQIAYHLVVDRSRHNQRLINLETVMEVSIQWVPSSQTQVEERSLMEALVFALNTDLTDVQRHVIILRFLEGFSLKETSSILGKKANYIKVIQNRAVARLRKSLWMDDGNDRAAFFPETDTR